MRGSIVARSVCAALLLFAAACPSWRGPVGGTLDDPTDLAPLTLPPRADLGWTGESRQGLLLKKAQRSLILYRHGRVHRVYPVVLGGNPSGPKLYEGDLHTPTGLYRIVRKSHHPRWSRFLLIDYPSLLDRHRHRLAMANGLIPLIKGRRPGPGGAIGIHGTDKTEFNAWGIDWTWGCISLSNEDVEELYELVPVGTPIRIDE